MSSQWNPYFSNSSKQSGASDLEKWVNQSATINGVKVYAYALLSGFGRGNSFLKYVSENLAQKFLHSSELESVLSQMKKIQPNGNMKNIDDRIIMLLKVVFVSVNADYNELYARQMSQMNSNDEADSLDNFDGLSLSDPHTNGCSAILAVIINDRLFVSNVGNSTAMLCKQLNEPKEMYLFQVSALHEDAEKTTDMGSLPNRSFGGPSSKQSEDNSQAYEPFVVSQGIQLDHTIRFLLFASPLAIKIVTQLNIDNMDNVNTYLASMVLEELDSTSSIQNSLHNVVDKLVTQYYRMDNVPGKEPCIALGFVDLQNDYTVDQLVEDNQNNVDSEVDWSEFATHELRDIFTATVNSLKQSQFELGSISEH